MWCVTLNHADILLVWKTLRHFSTFWHLLRLGGINYDSLKVGKCLIMYFSDAHEWINEIPIVPN